MLEIELPVLGDLRWGGARGRTQVHETDMINKAHAVSAVARSSKAMLKVWFLKDVLFDAIIVRKKCASEPHVKKLLPKPRTRASSREDT